ncbi:MAG: chromosomal replication initiator protein DnaA [Anaerolineae bacterium]|nr:chromosomal replication initiator protein DnaA [Anaerolineae bacterium]
MNAKDAWLATLGQLQVQLNRATYDTWLRRAELLSYEDGRFVVTVPNAYARDWIERHLLASMTETLTRIFRRPSELQLVVWDPVEPGDDAGGPLVALAGGAPAPEPARSEYPLHPDYTFDTFVAGESNRYAYLLSRAVAEGPVGRYSPVLLHGSMGVGKTHLLQAIAHALLIRGLHVLYLTAEDFTTELVAAIRDKQGAAFRERFRRADAVLIDDLQFVEGKDSTQAELVALWDAMRHRQRAMLFASTRLPCDMARLSQDARSRFQAGPIASIDLPDHPLRIAILDDKALRRRLALPPDVCDLLAARITGGVRDLEAAVEQIHTNVSLTGQAIHAAAEHVLRTLGAPARASAVTLDGLLDAVAAFYGLNVDDLVGRKRAKAIVRARQVAMYLARECTDASLPLIGQALGGRDHSTVLHGCVRIAEMLAGEPGFKDELDSLRTRLGGPASTPVPVAVTLAPLAISTNAYRS